MRKILATLLAAALCLTLLGGLSFSAATVNDFTVGTADSAVVSLAKDAQRHAACDPSMSTDQYVNPVNATTGDLATYAFNVEAAGDYYVGILYNSATTGRYLNVSVNGGTAAGIEFLKNSGAWGDKTNGLWYYHIIRATFVAGANTVKLSLDGTNKGVMVSDITAWPVSEWLTYADNPTTSGEQYSLVDCASSFDGKCFNAGNKTATVTWNVAIATPGTYRISVPYSSTRSSVPNYAVSINGSVVDNDNVITSTSSYGSAWGMLESEEFYLDAGVNVPVTLSWDGGAYLGGVRLELVESALPDSQMKDLTVSYTDETASGTVYSLDVTWENDDFVFDYNAGVQGEWNPEDHTFGETANAGWTDKDLTVTVVNHSNAAVKATLTVTDADATDPLTVTADKSEATLPTAENTAVADAPSVVYTLTINGTPSAAVAKVATATLSFAAGE